MKNAIERPTVADLIEALSMFPADMPVAFAVYDGAEIRVSVEAGFVRKNPHWHPDLGSPIREFELADSGLAVVVLDPSY